MYQEPQKHLYILAQKLNFSSFLKQTIRYENLSKISMKMFLVITFIIAN